jgi:hypothetical protein
MTTKEQITYERAKIEFCRTLKGVERNCWLGDFLLAIDEFRNRNKGFSLADFLLVSNSRGIPENQTLRLWRHFVIKMKEAGQLEQDKLTFRLV